MEKLADIDKLLSESKQDDHLDTVIADALNRLSVEDREKVYHGIHGVSNEKNPESPEFIDKKLGEMHEALVKIKEAGKLPTAAFELAEELSLEYVEDRKRRTTILATDAFDPQAATERLVHYFDFKFAMFGGEKLCKNITYDDLDEDDIYALQKGFLQWLPERDRAGRPVAVLFPSEQDYRYGCDVGRVFGRLLMFQRDMFGGDDVRSARTGFVLVIYNVGRLNIHKLYYQVPSVFVKAQNSMPVKPAAVHFCFSNPMFRVIAQNVLKLFRSDLLERGKIHQGSQQEVRYTLMTYGIPVDLLPMSTDGTMRRNRHSEMINAVLKKEENTKKGSKLDYYIIPYLNDVVFGKGGPSQDRPGNIGLKLTVDKLLPLYNTLDNQGKMELTKQVIDTVHARDGLFISKDFGVWMEVPEELARSKVATLFRNRRKAAAAALKKEAASKTARSELTLLDEQSSGKRVRV